MLGKFFSFSVLVSVVGFLSSFFLYRVLDFFVIEGVIFLGNGVGRVRVFVWDLIV